MKRLVPKRRLFKSGIQIKFIEALVNQLRDCFPHVELLGSFSIFDPQNLPSDEEQLTTYGQDEVKLLTTAYGEGPNLVVDAQQFTSEWEGFRMLTKTTMQSSPYTGRFG